MIDLGELALRILVDPGDSNRQLLQFGNNAGQAGNASNALTGALGRLVKGFTIAAVIKKTVDSIVACVKASDELKKAMNTLQAQTGATDSEMEGFGKSLKNIYANNYGESFEDIAQSMGEVKRQTGLAGKELELTTENALAMRDTFGFEVNESVRAVDMMMRQFGVTAEEAYNLIAQGAQKGLDKNGNLLDSVNEYAVHFKQLGFDSEEMFNMFSNGAKMGVFDIDKLGDAVKEFGIRTKDGSATTLEAYELLGLNAEELQRKFAEGGEGAKTAFAEVAQALNDCEDEVIKNTAGVNLFGTMFEDMGAEAVKALTQTNGEIKKTTDNLEKIKEIKYDSVGEAFTGIGRQLELGIMIPIGEKLLPLLNDFANWVNEHMSVIQEVFNGALGVIGGVAGSVIALYDFFTGSATPAIDLFADKITYAADGTRILEQEISDTTATAVGAYMDLERNAGESLAKIASMGDVITEEQTEAFREHCNTVKDSYGQMKDMVCQKLSEQYDQEKALLAKSFADSNALTEQQEAAILANLAEKQAAEQEAVAAQYAQINAIVAQAEAEKRALSLSEMQQIQAIQEEQKTNAVKTLSDTEMEARVILERMKSYNETVSIEIAAKTIQEAENARKAVVDEADQKYKDEIALALRMKEELGVIDDETYQQMVDDAQKRKDDTVKLAEKTKEETVAAMEAQNKELVNSVNLATGEIYTTLEVFKRKMSDFWEDVKGVFSSNSEKMQTTASQAGIDIAQSLTRELDVSVRMKLIGEQLMEGFAEGIESKKQRVVAAAAAIASLTIENTKAILDEHSPSRVFHEIGAYVSQGLAEGIADAGDLAVGEMEALAGKIISTGDALSTGILSKDAETGQILYDNLYTNTMNRIDLYYRDRDKRIALMDDGTEENIKSMQREVKETEKATDLKIKLYQQEYKAKMQLLDEESSEAVKALQDELDAIDAEEQQKQRQQEALEYEEKMNGLRKKLHFASEEERVTIAEEIRRAEADRQKVLDKQALQDKKDSIRQQMEQVREEAAEKKKALQEELEAKEYQLQQQRTAEVEHMNVVIALMQKQVETKKEMEKISADIAKKQEELKTEKLAEEKEAQTKKDLAELAIQQKAQQQAYAENEKLLNQWLGTYKQGQEDMTACLEEEAAKRQAYSSHELFPAASENGSGDLFPAQIEEQNALAAGQTEFKIEQWDVQTAYQAQKEQEQTKTAAQEEQKQSDNFIAQWKRCEMEFQNGLNRMRNLFQEFSASLQALSSQWGRYFYEGIASTEDDIVKYINKMVKKMREALENASYAAQGDFGERSIDGSHRNGLAYVPFDNYNAILHKGEAVLTAAENQAYRTGKGTGDKNVSVYVTQNIYSPTPDARQEQKRAAREFKKIALERC